MAGRVSLLEEVEVEALDAARFGELLGDTHLALYAQVLKRVLA